MLLHGGIELLGQVVGDAGHGGLLLVGSAETALVLGGFLTVLLLGILAISLVPLSRNKQLLHGPKQEKKACLHRTQGIGSDALEKTQPTNPPPNF